jgi:hypothetical protein
MPRTVRIRRLLQVRVREDEAGRIAGEFRRQIFPVRGGIPHDLPSRGGLVGEREPRHVGMCDQGVPRIGAGAVAVAPPVAGTVHDVDHGIGQACPGRDLRQQRGWQRCPHIRAEHHRAARGQGGREVFAFFGTHLS